MMQSFEFSSSVDFLVLLTTKVVAQDVYKMARL